MNIETEIEIVKAFFVPKKRERYIYFLNHNRRDKLLSELYHFGDFDPNCKVELSRSCNSAEGLLAELRRRGAVSKCYVMSVDQEIDGVTEPLADIIEKVFVRIEGTIVYCAPGKLAYYEGEVNRFILQKRSNNSLQRTVQKVHRR